MRPETPTSAGRGDGAAPGTASRPSADAEDRNDLGFGSVLANESRTRLLNRDGTFNADRHGLGWLESQSLYHAAISSTWPRFLATLGAGYVSINLLFAAIYVMCGPDALIGTPAATLGGSYARAFFFSVETFATIGYGEVAPAGVPAHVVMVVQAFLALGVQALGTGLIFARFARPTAAIRFSRSMVVAPHAGGRALMFRVVNTRRNQITDLGARVMFSALVPGASGMGRRFHTLALERPEVMFFPLLWTVVHPITPDSPLWGMTEEMMRAEQVEFLVILSGVDETFAQHVHTRSSYRAEEVVWGAKFRSAFDPPRPDGRLAVDVGRLDDWDRVPLAD